MTQNIWRSTLIFQLAAKGTSCLLLFQIPRICKRCRDVTLQSDETWLKKKRTLLSADFFFGPLPKKLTWLEALPSSQGSLIIVKFCDGYDGVLTTGGASFPEEDFPPLICLFGKIPSSFWPLPFIESFLLRFFGCWLGGAVFSFLIKKEKNEGNFWEKKIGDGANKYLHKF